MDLGAVFRCGVFGFGLILMFRRFGIPVTCLLVWFLCGWVACCRAWSCSSQRLFGCLMSYVGCFGLFGVWLVCF